MILAAEAEGMMAVSRLVLLGSRALKSLFQEEEEIMINWSKAVYPYTWNEMHPSEK